MEKLADKREQFRVEIRKKHHSNMLFERRIRLMEECNRQVAGTEECREIVQRALHRLFTQGSLEALVEVRKLSCSTKMLQFIVGSEQLVTKACLLMDHNNDYTEPQRQAAWILANLTSVKSFADQTAKRLGVASLMLRRLNIYGDVTTKESCLWALNNLIPNNAELKHWLISNGLIKLLLGMLKERLDESQTTTLLSTIMRLIGDHEDPPMEYSLFRPFNKSLFQLLNSGQYESNRQALFCLSRFTQLDTPQIFIADLKMSKIMKRVLSVGARIKQGKAVFIVLLLVGYYACNPENIQQLLRENIFSSVESMIKDADDRVVLEGLRVVKFIIVEKEALAKFMEHKLMSTATELAQQGTGDIRLQAIDVLVHCLRNGEETPSNRVNLVDVGWILRGYYEQEPNLDPYIQRVLQQTLQLTDKMEVSQ